MQGKSGFWTVTIMFLMSCGQNAEVKRVQQEQINDSLHYTDKNYYKYDKTVLRLDSVRKEYVKKRARLVVAYEKRTKAEKFHILRSEEEKQKEIQQQNLAIERLEDSLNATAKAMSFLEKKAGRGQ